MIDDKVSLQNQYITLLFAQDAPSSETAKSTLVNGIQAALLKAESPADFSWLQQMMKQVSAFSFEGSEDATPPLSPQVLESIASAFESLMPDFDAFIKMVEKMYREMTVAMQEMELTAQQHAWNEILQKYDKEKEKGREQEEAAKKQNGATLALAALGIVAGLVGGGAGMRSAKASVLKQPKHQEAVDGAKDALSKLKSRQEETKLELKQTVGDAQKTAQLQSTKRDVGVEINNAKIAIRATERDAARFSARRQDEAAFGNLGTTLGMGLPQAGSAVGGLAAAEDQHDADKAGADGDFRRASADTSNTAAEHFGGFREKALAALGALNELAQEYGRSENRAAAPAA